MAQPPPAALLVGAIGEIRPFDPNGPVTFSQWEQMFSAYCSANFISPEPVDEAGNVLPDTNRRRNIFLTVVGERSFALLSDSVLPQMPNQVPIPTLVNILKNRYEPPGLLATNRYRFFNRVQQGNESVTEFVAALQHMAAPCQFGPFLADALRDRIVCGVSSASTREKLLGTPNLSFQAARHVALQDEAIRVHSRSIALSTPVHAVQSRNFASKPPQRQGPKSQPDSKKPGSNKGNTQRSPNKDKPCYRCGGQHNPEKCYCKTWTCAKCKKVGHVKKVCKSVSVNNIQQPETEAQQPAEEEPLTEAELEYVNYLTKSMGKLNGVDTLSNPDSVQLEPSDSAIYKVPSCVYGQPSLLTDIPSFHCVCVNVLVNNVNSISTECVLASINGLECSMEIDTGSGVSLMSHTMFYKLFPAVNLSKCAVILNTLTNPISVVGEAVVSVLLPHRPQANLKLVVCKSTSEFVPLMGRDWLDVLFPKWRDIFHKTQSVHNIANDKEALLVFRSKYPLVFATNVDTPIVGFVAHLTLKENAVPIVLRPYPMPYALQLPVEAKLQSLLDTQKASKVSQTKWASPILPILKKDNSVRLCVDFKRTVNPALKVDIYPLPNPQDIFSTLSGGIYFCVLDLTDAYTQLSVDESSQELLTANTHKGLYRFKRLVYGVASAPAIFQSVMDQILSGLPHVSCYLDDILIKGVSLSDCISNVDLVLSRLNTHNVRINIDKCKWFVTEVEYLGFIINKDGIKPSPKKILSVLEMVEPKDKKQMRSFLGMLNVYMRFLPNLSSICAPLRQLIKNNVPYQWTDACQEAFDRCKLLLSSSELHVHFDITKPIVICCDASPTGLGACLSHVYFENGIEVEKPVLHVSTALSDTQARYSQIDREALAIMFAISKFHKFIYGRSFVLATDNKPLKHIFSPEKGLPVLAASRLQHWAAILSGYDFIIVHRPADKMGPVDALSRLHSDTVHSITISACDPMVLDSIPMSHVDIADATALDSVLSRVITITKLGWPKQCSDDSLKPYFNIRNNLSVLQNCLLFGNRVIVPLSLQSKVLRLIHLGHPGKVRSKMLARSHFFWPSMNTDIENMCSTCIPCAAINPKKEDFIPWPQASAPFERLHLDFFEYEKIVFLIVCDSYSKWIDVVQMTSHTALDLVQQMYKIFAIFGPPLVIVTDNGQPFASQLFKDFCTSQNVSLLHSPAYHAPSNGRAERAVRICKEALKKLSLEARTPIFVKLFEFLHTYRNTPSTVTNLSPNQMLLNFQPRTFLNMLNPKMDLEFSTSPFREGDRVIVNIKKSPPVEGVLVRKLSSNRYLISVQGVLKKVHLNQLSLIVQNVLNVTSS